MLSDSLTDGPKTEDITRGVLRLLVEQGYKVMREVVLPNGRRVDAIGLNAKGIIWIVEVKSSRADFVADNKWSDYLDYGDHFSFAVAEDFPVDLLPEEEGLIIADRFGADVIRQSQNRPLAAARRKSLVNKLALKAMERLNEAEL